MTCITEVANEADHIHKITMDEARALPNMLGVLCAAQFRLTGWYGCTQNGEKHLYVLKDEITVHNEYGVCPQCGGGDSMDSCPACFGTGSTV